jgi:Na+/H+ antiporter NhaA
MDTGNLLQCQKEENGLDGGVDFHSLVCCSLLCGIGFDMFVKKTLFRSACDSVSS